MSEGGWVNGLGWNCWAGAGALRFIVLASKSSFIIYPEIKEKARRALSKNCLAYIPAHAAGCRWNACIRGSRVQVSQAGQEIWEGGRSGTGILVLVVKKGGPMPRIKWLVWHHTAVSSVSVQLSQVCVLLHRSSVYRPVLRQCGEGWQGVAGGGY